MHRAKRIAHKRAGGLRDLDDLELAHLSLLCGRHNSALSPLDACAAEVFRTTRHIDRELGDDAPPGEAEAFTIVAADLERWLHKCALGIASAGADAERLHEQDLCVRILFGEAPWPEKWGLYIETPAEGFHSLPGLGSASFVGRNDGTVWGRRINIGGLHLVIVLGGFEVPSASFRSCGARWRHARSDVLKTLAFAWPEPPFTDYVEHVRIRSRDSSACAAESR